ncbi:hypothetical protein CLM74_10845 [Stenotrophomonas sp. MYb57]|nr:hypothetical protein CLM74_10845 [Stenotrophomonas sp. MYb57]
MEIARHPGKVFEEMSVSNGRVDCRFVQASLTTSLNTLNGLGWKEDEIAALPPECIPTMVALQISIKAYLDFGPRLLQKCQSNVTLAVSTPEYEAVANASAQLRIESSEVIDALLARIDGIRDLLLELQAAH